MFSKIGWWNIEFGQMCATEANGSGLSISPLRPEIKLSSYE